MTSPSKSLSHLSRSLTLLLRRQSTRPPVFHGIQRRSTSFSRILASSALANPPEHIRPLPTTRPRLQLPREINSHVYEKSSTVEIEIDGEWCSFDTFFLRDLCPCPKCVDTSTRQKLFNSTDLPIDIVPRAIKVKSKGVLEVIWNYPEEHPHVSHYDPELLLRYSTSKRRRDFRFPAPRPVYWDGETMKQNILRVDYERVLKDDETLHQLLMQIHLYGLAYFVNVPSVKTDGKELIKLAERIGEVKQTFYGKVWDVKSVPESKNIAYTNLNLGLHMDLMYYASPPGLQFLHCLRNTVKGGSSIFIDSFRASTLLRLAHPKAYFQTLTTFPVPFHYINDNRHYYFSRPTIVVDPHDPAGLDIAAVNYAPPFQAPFEVKEGQGGKADWRRFVWAFKAFAEICEREEMRFEETLKEGECVVFANRRVLHARRAFETEAGERWLKGIYVDWDDFESKLRVSVDQFGSDLGTRREYSVS